MTVLSLMKRQRASLQPTLAACALLGRLIRVARKEQRWSEHALAERALISRSTLQKVERGDPSVAIGIVFDCAHLVGVPLFADTEPSSPVRTLGQAIARADDRLALLPKRVRTPVNVDDDF